MFVDKATIMVKGGDGGNGCCSFRREKFVPKGGPDGGDGGGGGSVILRSCTGEQSLVAFVYNRHYAGERGPHGKGKNMHGRRRKDIILNVPVGTVVTDADTGELIVDLDQPDIAFVVAKGGNGGRGNARFVTSRNRVPMTCEAGYPGDERLITLELKTMADIGLVGFPNAGKSTLLGKISSARPKVAPYPFTTLHPVVGVVELPDFKRLTVADIPGLIDGAHDNIGLGHSFLKHIERTHALAFILDMAGVDGRTPWSDFRHLQDELELYMKGLSRRPAVIIANKMDLPGSAENLELLKDELSRELIDIIPVSAERGENLATVINKFSEIIEK
ncbi:MAG: GTPase ObgE [Victivallaceae bacterium]|nr:GTPase ObgE [Victivallaceae bacterium]